MLVTKKPCVRMRQLEDTGLGEKRGDNTEGAPTKTKFGTIPYILVIADYEKAYMCVALT
jgi:hypothetical protein